MTPAPESATAPSPDETTAGIRANRDGVRPFAGGREVCGEPWEFGSDRGSVPVRITDQMTHCDRDKSRRRRSRCDCDETPFSVGSRAQHPPLPSLALDRHRHAREPDGVRAQIGSQRARRIDTSVRPPVRADSSDEGPTLARDRSRGAVRARQASLRNSSCLRAFRRSHDASPFEQVHQSSPLARSRPRSLRWSMDVDPSWERTTSLQGYSQKLVAVAVVAAGPCLLRLRLRRTTPSTY